VNDLESTEAMLTKAGIVFRVGSVSPEYKERKNHGEETILTVDAKVGPNNLGDSRSFSHLGFDADGALLWWGPGTDLASR
jgi:hypothetical protein